MSRAPFIERLTLERFRSIRDEAVDFANPTVLVGSNNSGKSNLIDAFAFTSDCMRRALTSALESRGGIQAVSHRTPGRRSGEPLGIRLDFRLIDGDGSSGHYAFRIREAGDHGLLVQREQCVVSRQASKPAWFDRTDTTFHSSIAGTTPALDPQALVLPIVGGVEQFTPLLRALAAMRVYMIDPTRMRVMQDADGGSMLKRDGSNVASILLDLARREPEVMDRIQEILSSIAPSITQIRPIRRGNKLTLKFTQQSGEHGSITFDASEMSDGVLYFVGTLTAAMQGSAPSLIAIEEPEMMLHPGALGAVLDTIRVAAQRSQVIITTHSPELLDAKWIGPDNLRVAHWESGTTHISRLGIDAVRALQEHRMSAGELFRANALDLTLLAGPTPPPLFDQVPV